MKNILTYEQFILNEAISRKPMNEASIKTIASLFQNKGIKDAIKKERIDVIRKAIEDEGLSTKGVTDEEILQIAKDLSESMTFDEIENEYNDTSSQIDESRKRMKPFNRVKVGDKGEDYHGDVYKVIAKGTGKDYVKSLKKFDKNGAIEDMKANPESFGIDLEEFDDLEFVAVEDEKTKETTVFLYDGDGFSIYENDNVYINEKSEEKIRDEFSDAVLIRDEGDLPEGTEVQVNAEEYSSKGDEELVNIIKPNGESVNILRGNLRIKI